MRRSAAGRTSRLVLSAGLSLCTLAGSWSAASARWPAAAGRSSAPAAVAPALSLDGYLRDAHLWHQIDTSHPGVRLLSAEPFIFAVDDFLSADEADALAARVAGAEAAPSSARLLGRGERTSLSVLAADDEVGWLRQRIAALARVRPSQMQPLKLTRYAPGGKFMRHTDVSVWLDRSEPAEPERRPDRFCTVLIYLNDCDGNGGRTCWRWLDEDPSFYERLRLGAAARLPAWVRGGRRAVGPRSRPRELCVAPRKGMAVVHFPCTSPAAGLVYDPNADHESEEVHGPKYVAQQFIWSAPMDGAEVHEDLRRRFAALRDADDERRCED